MLLNCPSCLGNEIVDAYPDDDEMPGDDILLLCRDCGSLFRQSELDREIFRDHEIVTVGEAD